MPWDTEVSMGDFQELRETISQLPKGDLAKIVQSGTYHKAECKGAEVEEFSIHGYKAIRLKHSDIDIGVPTTIPKARVAIDVERLTDQAVRKPAALELERWIMAALEARGVYVPGRQDLMKHRRHNLRRLAIEILWLHKDKWDSTRVEMQAGLRTRNIDKSSQNQSSSNIHTRKITFGNTTVTELQQKLRTSCGQLRAKT